jgi:hypothetical protein
MDGVCFRGRKIAVRMPPDLHMEIGDFEHPQYLQT